MSSSIPPKFPDESPPSTPLSNSCNEGKNSVSANRVGGELREIPDGVVMQAMPCDEKAKEEWREFMAQCQAECKELEERP